MKFRKISRDEMKLIENCTSKFKGEIKFNKFVFFVDKFNKVYLYDGMPINLKSMNVLSMGLYVGKFEKDNTFTPLEEFLDAVKPTACIFEIENINDAINFMKGMDIYFCTGSEKKYGIKSNISNIVQNFGDDSLIAIKYKNTFLGTGKFSNKKIINKISKRRKLH